LLTLRNLVVIAVSKGPKGRPNRFAKKVTL
jgi:hypothetical protein